MVLCKLSVSIIVGQGPITLAVGAGGVWLGHFFSRLSFLASSSLWYRLKYCLKGPLNPKQPNHPLYMLVCPCVYMVSGYMVTCFNPPLLLPFFKIP